ncbi:MAG: ATP-binding protein, partial [Prevotella sp.]|nr:ATP-binding protein [Prevotella sp.]
VDGPKAPNVSQLAIDIDTSRATVMNYIKYLADARLINMIYPLGQSFPKKPSKVMLHNPNLMYAIYPSKVEQQDVMETFFVNSLWKDHKVNQASHDTTYQIDGRFRFIVIDALHSPTRQPPPGTISFRYNTEVGKDGQLPLWLLGFLY